MAGDPTVLERPVFTGVVVDIISHKDAAAFVKRVAIWMTLTRIM
jgi:hypothetical protein